MATQLHKISWPELTSSNFGVGLREAFENIDSNFQKLASLGLTAGAPGIPAIWIPYNLNSVFCHINDDVFQSNYLNSEHIDAIQESYNKYNAITGLSKTTYIEECKRLYKQLVRDLPDNKDTDDQPIDVTSGSDESSKTWRHKWEILPNSSTFIFDDLTDNDWLLKNYIGYTNHGTYNPGQYLDFIPGDILVAGNWDEEFKIFSKLSTTAHIYIDPRFRNPMTIAGEVNTEQLARATDQSCVVYGSKDDDEFKFEYVYAFPRVHCKDGEFYLSANGVDTNIPLTGRPGESGKNARFAAVQIKDESSYYDQINKIVYGSSDDPAEKTFAIGNNIGSTGLGDNPELLDGCPALIFPPAGYTANAYVTLYWVGYLKYDNDSKTLTAYCGRENLVVVDLYEHSFGGMMMGLDMYEQSKARPVGNAPWTKPRGLMLPIGARYIGAERNEYWNPYEGYDDEGNPKDVSDINHFGAHLIYSEGGDGDDAYQQKHNLHISSVKDYRKFGPADDLDKKNHSPKPEDLVSGTKLFIDEATTITDYGSSNPTINTLFTNMGSSEIKGNEKVSGYLDVNGYGKIGQYLCVGTGDQDDTTAGTINATKFKRRNAQSGQLLLANGNSTAAMPLVAEFGPDLAIAWENLSSDGAAKIKITLPQPKIEYIGAQQILKVGTHRPSGDTHTWRIGTDWTRDDWSNADAVKALGAPGGANISFPSDDKCRGHLAGIAVSYRMSNLILTRVIIAANSNWHENSGVKYFGLPIDYSKSGVRDEVARFTNMNIGRVISEANPKRGIVSAYWGAQQSWVTYEPGDGWQRKDYESPAGGVVCSIDSNGQIYLSGASVNCLFARTETNNNAYLEFNLIYEGQEISETYTYTHYWKYADTTIASPTIIDLSNQSHSGGYINSDWDMSNKDWLLITGKYTGPSDTAAYPTVQISQSGNTYSISGPTDEWKEWSIEKREAFAAPQSMYKHYWKLSSAPTNGTQLNTTPTNENYKAPNNDGTNTVPNSWYEDNNVWYLVSVSATKANIASYSNTYNTSNTEAGYTKTDWSCEPKTPSNVTYEWKQTDNNILAYLEHTLLAYKAPGYTGALFDDYDKEYTRYEGFRGVVEISTYMDGNTRKGDLTIDCWDSSWNEKRDHYTITYDTGDTNNINIIPESDHAITIIIKT